LNRLKKIKNKKETVVVAKTDGQMDRRTDGQMDRWTDGKTERQKERQTDRKCTNTIGKNKSKTNTIKLSINRNQHFIIKFSHLSTKQKFSPNIRN
jgi:hypothetical protein